MIPTPRPIAALYEPYAKDREPEPVAIVAIDADSFLVVDAAGVVSAIDQGRVRIVDGDVLTAVDRAAFWYGS